MSRIVVFSDFAERECPWFRLEYVVNNGYGCSHPAQEHVEIVPAGDRGRKCLVEQGKCYSFSCPLGASLNPDMEDADADLMKNQGLDPDDYEDGEMFLLMSEGV